jgi:hypothetical protein
MSMDVNENFNPPLDWYAVDVVLHAPASHQSRLNMPN